MRTPRYSCDPSLMALPHAAPRLAALACGYERRGPGVHSRPGGLSPGGGIGADRACGPAGQLASGRAGFRPVSWPRGGRDSGRSAGLGAGGVPAGQLEDVVRPGDELDHPGREPQGPPELHRRLVRQERLQLDPVHAPGRGEARELLDHGPSHAAAPMAGPDHDAGDLQGPFVAEPRGDSGLRVGHAHHVAVLLGHHDQPVVGLLGLPVLHRNLVVEPGAGGEHPPVPLQPVELLEQRDDCREILRDGLSDLQPILLRTTRAGFPATTEYAGITPFTTALAPSTDPRPTTEPRRTVAPCPIQQSPPIRTLDFTIPCRRMGTAGSRYS